MLNQDAVIKVAKISRLKLSEKEISKFTKDIDDILIAFKLMNEVNTDKIEPSFQPFEIKNAIREDYEEKSLTQEDALKNAKQKEKKFFKGPRSV